MNVFCIKNKNILYFFYITIAQLGGKFMYLYKCSNYLEFASLKNFNFNVVRLFSVNFYVVFKNELIFQHLLLFIT